jgi:hypothetical protein
MLHLTGQTIQWLIGPSLVTSSQTSKHCCSPFFSQALLFANTNLSVLFIKVLVNLLANQKAFSLSRS